ncbi:MAG: hypothetical protein HRT35_17450, partial [Algicola sp.]|nr:hypothetical protein [Algicola sp.]
EPEQIAETGQGMSLAELTPMLTQLLDLLDEYDMEAEGLLEDILGKAGNSPLRSQLQPLRQQISSYDFEQAAEVLRALI